MAQLDAFADAEGSVRGWINSLTATLVGTDKPLPRGAFLKRLRSPYQGAYALLTNAGGGADWGADVPAHRARISASIYGVTKEAAAAAAIAYANHVRGLAGGRDFPDGTRCATADSITLLYSPDGDEERYLVDAEFYLIPAVTPVP